MCCVCAISRSSVRVILSFVRSWNWTSNKVLDQIFDIAFLLSVVNSNEALSCFWLKPYSIVINSLIIQLPVALKSKSVDVKVFSGWIWFCNLLQMSSGSCSCSSNKFHVLNKRRPSQPDHIISSTDLLFWYPLHWNTFGTIVWILWMLVWAIPIIGWSWEGTSHGRK